jgi:hypothetical protein
MNQLLGEVPKLVLEKTDVKTYRENKLQLQDAKEFSVKSDPDRTDLEIPDISEPLKQLDLIAELNAAFKTMEILGQILKNYSGSLEGPLKLELAEESYMLGLRALDPFYQLLRDNKENLIKWIKYSIGEEKPGEKEFTEAECRVILFALIGGLTYAFIKAVSSSVGSEHLSPTFKEILDKHDITSVNLIDISIKLDYYRRFPYDDLKRVKERVAGNILPYALLREMVRDYLYMFTTDYKEKQRICQLVGIPVVEQLMIDKKSTEKKSLSS